LIIFVKKLSQCGFNPLLSIDLLQWAKATLEENVKIMNSLINMAAETAFTTKKVVPIRNDLYIFTKLK